MDDLTRKSVDMYLGLCQIRPSCIGTPTEVTIRRDVQDMEEMIMRPAHAYTGEFHMITGSKREGFRFQSSDLDIMSWSTNVTVIYKLSNLVDFANSIQDIVLMVHSETPPGFVKLKLMTQTTNKTIFYSAVTHGNSKYLSSEKFSNASCDRFKMLNFPGTKIQRHGPCTSFNSQGMEYDYANGIYCQYWPKTALSWFERCQKNKWPSKIVQTEIMSNGCHVMPIGSRIISDENELEWRLSFSRAELKLVYSMNHTQFMCYALLKIFSKEVLQLTVDESLVCSYFLKTVLFWEIQQNPDRDFWCPSKLVSCFWACFKRFCKFVFDSYCPNFFIPENNMFKNKIVGNTRKHLFKELIHYYNMKEACLFKSHTLGEILQVLVKPLPYIPPISELHTLSVLDVRRCINRELCDSPYFTYSKRDCYEALMSITKLLQQPQSKFKSLALQFGTSYILVKTAFILSESSAPSTNKTRYRKDRTVINMLGLSSKIGPVSQSLYLGLYYFRTGRYVKVLDMVKVFHHKSQKVFEMFDPEIKTPYSEETPLKIALVKAITFRNSADLMAELELEYQESGRCLLIPPFVFAHMLCMLSNYRLGNKSQCNQSVNALRILLNTDSDNLVPSDMKSISWQILGICQHVVGDLLGAFESYKESLKTENLEQRIKNATLLRLSLTLFHLSNISSNMKCKNRQHNAK